MNSLTPSQPVDPEAEAQPPQQKLWYVGTLTYTTAGLIILSCWLLWGDFAWSMRDRVVPPVMQLLFKKFGASDMTAGILFASLPSALGLFIGPFIAYKSDRLRSRWGRRMPFLFITTPVIVFSIVGLAFSAQLGAMVHRLLGVHSGGLDASILFSLGVFWTIFEIALVIVYGVFSALVNDVVPQEVLGRFFAAFRIISLVAGFLFNYWVIGEAEDHFAAIFFGMALLYGIGFTLMCLRVKEGDYPPPAQLPPGADSPWAATKGYFKDGFQPYYLWFFGATILTGMATQPFNLYSIFYAKSIGMDMKNDYGHSVAWCYLVSIVLAYPLGSLCDRLHPLRMSIAVLIAYAGVMAWSSLFVHDVHSFTVAMIAHVIVSGCFYTVSSSLNQRLLPRAKFASVGSVGGVIGSIINVGFAPTLGFLLDRSGHDYRITFESSFFITVAAIVSCLILHAKFMALGGPKHYVAPE